MNTNNEQSLKTFKMWFSHIMRKIDRVKENASCKVCENIRNIQIIQSTISGGCCGFVHNLVMKTH